MGDVAVVIPARDEAERIAATIDAAAGIAGVDLLVVVDDGSTDATTAVARGAGALVLRHERNRGKAAALETGAAEVARRDSADHPAPRLLLLLDADLGRSAAAAADLVPPVRIGAFDMTIANLPAGRDVGGGRGRVVRLAARGIHRATGAVVHQPLCGQRCLTRRAFEAALPLAHGFGVETGMTIDVLRAGLSVCEIRCELEHRVTGADWSGVRHRATQYADVAAALARRIRPVSDHR
ncbi:MAG TPA: glycosyltransferase [Sporichthyaceae bacterium]|nr:glycosyltransferase [Sporichthyaceae bacterium]